MLSLIILDEKCDGYVIMEDNGVRKYRKTSSKPLKKSILLTVKHKSYADLYLQRKYIYI